MDAHALARVQEDHTNLSRVELLNILKKNRDNHVVEYNELMVGWRAAYVDAARERAQVLLAESSALAAGDDVTISEVWNGPEKPISHEDAYTTIIRRMELSKDEAIYLSHVDFSKYVMDEWTWSGHTKRMSALYGG